MIVVYNRENLYWFYRNELDKIWIVKTDIKRIWNIEGNRFSYALQNKRYWNCRDWIVFFILLFSKMKHIKLCEFKINSSIARNIARQWGEVNHTYKTNRKWAYYFSCSWHWWFIIDWQALTMVEKDLFKKINITPYTINIIVGTSNKDWLDYVLHISYQTRRAGNRILYFSSEFENKRRVEYNYYEGEEDCNRALYSYFLDIQYWYTNTDWQEIRLTKDRAEPTIKNWFWKQWEQYNWLELKEWESHEKDNCQWNLKNKWKYIVHTALSWDTWDKQRRWHLKIDNDKCFCEARLYNIDDDWYIWKRIWEPRFFIIPTEVYHTRWNRGYVIWSNPIQEIEIF